MHLFENIPIRLDPEKVTQTLHPGGGCRRYEDILPFIDTVLSQIDPRAAYAAVKIELRGEDYLQIDGLTITSRILTRHAILAKPIFPFVATLGGRIEEAIRGSRDVLEQYYLETIANLALAEGVKELNLHLRHKYHLCQLYSLSPGSLSDWPLEEQKKVFVLLGKVEDTLGVRLTEYMVMIPRISLSGLLFPSDMDFCQCQLCQIRDRCQMAKRGEDLGN